MQYFKTAQLYFKPIIRQFDILAISEHSLFEEQLGILKTATDGTYNYHAVSASDNPRIISGEQAHGGVALLWKYSINDFVTPIKSIQSDRIVGIKCEFSGCRPLFILGVYLPSSNHTLDEFQECLDLLWALYESLSADGFVIVLGDVNGDFGNCLGVRGKKEPNVRGKLLIDFANFFNVCPVNLLSSCSGPLETYIFHCGRFRSTIDHILLPNYLRNKIIVSKTFDFDADNTSDHQPIILKLDYITQLSNDQPVVIPVRKQKVHWSKFSQEAINTNYVDPLLFDLSTLVWPETSDLNQSVEFISDLLLKNSLSLAAPRSSRRKKRKFGVYASLPYDVKEARVSCKDAFETWKQVDCSAESDEHDAYKAKHKDYRLSMRSFLNQLESDRVTKLCSAADSDEKLFWKLLKGQKSSSQMSAFLVNGSLITDINEIRNMWADHFQALGTSSESATYDNGFAAQVSAHVRETFDACLDDRGILNDPLTYDEIASVCSKLKPGVCGFLLDYEHIRYAGHPLWNLLFILCHVKNAFANFLSQRIFKKGLSCLCLSARARKQITKIATVA